MTIRDGKTSVSQALLRNIWKEYSQTIFSEVNLEAPKVLRIVEAFEDQRVASYLVTFKPCGGIVSEYSFLMPPNERAAREAMIHEMVHHCDAVVNGPSTELKHGRYFFSWKEKVARAGFHLGMKVNWE